MLPRRSPAKVQRSRRNTVKVEKPKRAGASDSRDWGRVRLWVVGIFFGLIWISLWGRAFYLQIIMGPEYAAMAKRQYTASEEISGVRGSILDRNGNVMALSVDCRSVWTNPALIKDKQATAVKLAQILNIPMNRIFAQLQGKKQFVWLARKLDYNVAEKIKELALPGIFFDSEYERVYPYKHLAGQLLGFVDIDDKGIEGLEKSFEDRLGGRKVRQYVERDAAGRRLMAQGTEQIGDLRGQDVHLTLDTQVQFFAEEALEEHVEKFGAKWGGCMVVDVPSGDILAWAQYPFFDPNNVLATPTANRRNRLATDMLEQGSTIKSFLIAAALEEKVITPSTVINCEKGRWKLKNVTLHDDHPYANLTVDKVLHVSSNIGAAKIGMKLGASKYRDYLMRLGFGARTDLPLASEAKGILRTSQRWADIDLATSSFGQSFSTTLVQMAQAYLCLASDGVKKPLRLAIDRAVENDSTGFKSEDETPELPAPGEAVADGTGPSSEDSGAGGKPAPQDGRYDKIFSSTTMKQVRAMLREVVEEDGGTGKQARIPGIEVGGKTGTAQKADKSGRYGKGRVGSFVGMIPIENPRYLVLVLLDEPTKVQYGGVIAAPVFRHVALRTMAYHGLLPDTDDPIVKAVAQKEAERKAKAGDKKTARTKAAVAAKNTGKGAGQETSRIALSGAGAEKTGKAGDKGIADQGDAGAAGPGTIPGTGQNTASQPGIVPAVVGLGLRSAVEVFAAEGIVPVIKGKGGFVVRQTPEAGSPWNETGKECTLWIEERAS